jgi:hypothetical protein
MSRRVAAQETTLEPSVSSLLNVAVIPTAQAPTSARVTDRGNYFAIAEQNQIEEQRQLRFNERRTIGYRGNDRRE